MGRMEQLTNQVSFRLGFNGIVNDVVIRETQRIVDARAEHIVSRLKVMCGMFIFEAHLEPNGGGFSWDASSKMTTPWQG